MKKLFTILICFTFLIAKAQNPSAKGHNEKGIKRSNNSQGIELTAGAGTTMPNATFKNETNTGNFTNFKFGAFIPILNYGGASGGVVNKFGGASGGVINFGLNVHAEYFTGNSDYLLGGALGGNKTYNITGQSTNPTISAKGAGSPKEAGFKIGGGIQANFSFGKYILSPLVNASYLNYKQQAFTITQNSSVNGQSYSYDLYRQAETKTSGVAFTPVLRHQYKFGSFGVFAETGYQFGPNVKTNGSILVPEGAANTQGNYNINQLNSATRTASTKNTKLNGFVVNAGVSFSFPSKMRNAANSMVQNNFGEKVAGGLQSGAGALSQGTSKTNNQDISPIKRSVTGNLNYEENYAVQDQKTLEFLQSKSVIIKKGSYPVDYSQNPFGTVTLTLANPISAKGIGEKGLKRLSASGYHCDKDCKEEKDVCWNCKAGGAKALFYHFDLTPVVTNGMITQLQIKNTKVSVDGKNLTADEFAALRNAAGWKDTTPPQNIIYGGNPPPILLCYKLFNLAGQQVTIDGFVDMHSVYSISLTPCGGQDPHAFVAVPSTSTKVSGQTINAKLVADDGKSQKEKSIKIEKDIDVSKDLAENYKVENVFIKAGTYQFNDKNEVFLPFVFGQSSEPNVSGNPQETQTNPRLKCDCGTDIYGKDREACKRICQFLKDGTYSSIGLNPNIKNGEHITVKSQVLTLPNQMGIGWQPMEQITSSNKKVTYQDLTADEAKKIDQLPITYLLPGKVTLATTDIKNLGEQNNQFDWYWKVYKSNKGAYVAVPMPLIMNEEGLKNLGGAMRKSNGSASGGTTEQAPCKFIYRSLPVDMSYLSDIGEDEIYLQQIDFSCRGTNLVFAPPGDATATAQLPNMPSKIVYNADGTTMRILANNVSKAQTLNQAKFSSTYIEAYGMVVYPMDYGISNAEASILVNGMFKGSKKINVAKKSSEENSIKYFAEENFTTSTLSNEQDKSKSEGCISEAYKSWAYTNDSDLDINHRVMILTPQSSMQGLIPVYLNPTTIDFQLMGYVSGHHLKYRIDAISPTTWMPALGSTFYSTSTASMTKTVNISSLPAGKYSISAIDLWPEESKRMNMCAPYFIIAKTLVNTTKLPSCIYPTQTIPITWTGGNGNSHVNLIVRRNLTPVAYVPINISVPNTGSYNLVIPNTGFAVGESYSVEVNDGNQYASSTYYNQANVFKICQKTIKKGTLTKTPLSTQIKPGALLEPDKCDCGTWEIKQIKFSGAAKDIVCGGSIDISRNTNAMFNLKYNCLVPSANFTAKYEVTIAKPNGSISTILITNNLNWNYLFNMAGQYILTFKVSYNDKLCDTCTYNILVK